ncbi:Uncharacterized protein pbN1_39570 [Aromatoleum bremense]|nr:Uncharacterized protein pbN1_39570 [Aromatoleum bremense]
MGGQHRQRCQSTDAAQECAPAAGFKKGNVPVHGEDDRRRSCVLSAREWRAVTQR